MNRIAVVSATLTAGLAGGLIAFSPLAVAAPVVLADGPTSTAQSQQNVPISAETGAPVGDATFGTNPLIPFGTDPQSQVQLGYVNPNHDEGVTANGQVDTSI